MRFDSILSGATIVLPETGELRAELAIHEGRVAALLTGEHGAEAAETIDAAGKLVLPGVIDPHVHLGLGAPETDTLTETRAAARHGVTTLISYLMSPQPYEAEYRFYRQRIQEQAHVDVALHAVPCTETHLAEIERYVDEFGISSFKCFLSFRCGEGAYLGIPDTDDGYLYALAEKLGQRRETVLNVHAENIEVTNRIKRRFEGEPTQSLHAWEQARPRFAEAESALRALYFAREHGATCYLVHLSSARALEEARLFRQRYDGVRVETCPHYLTHDVTSAVGLLGKQNPPLRYREDVEVLWAGIKDGSVDTIGSDHAPRSKQQKLKNATDIWRCSPGQVSLPVILPVLLSEGVHRRGLPLQRAVQVVATNAAKIFGLYPKKGTLLPGSDADLVVVDLDKEQRITPALLGGRADWSIYDGHTYRGWPVLTMLRGRVIARAGEVIGEAGFGDYLFRPLGRQPGARAG